MSNPTISPGYGYVICSHDDPKRSHILNECSEWNQPCHGECDKCAKFPARKPVEIPDGWELVPEGEPVPEGFQWLHVTLGSTAEGQEWHGHPTGYADFKNAIAAIYGNPMGAFIRRKSVQPTVEPSKPAVDWSKPLQTRDGRKARLLGVIKCDNSEASGTHVVASMLDDSAESVDIVFTNGRSYSPAKDSDDDIINAPERIKREVWLNVYQHSEYYGYDSKDEADDCAMQTRVACVRVQIDCEKGEGL
jgi:hypothetical protein